MTPHFLPAVLMPPPTEGYSAVVLRLFRQPRWIGLVLLVLFSVVVCYFLARWQWSRYEGRVQANSVQALNDSRPAVPVSTLLTPSTTIDDATNWRLVTATGRYDTAAQVYVRKRPLDNTLGFWVATPLVMDGGVVLVVNRGWMPAGSDSLATPIAPAPPGGTVTVTGRIQGSQQSAGTRPADLPAGQVASLETSNFRPTTGKPVLPGYVNLVSSDPAQAAGLTPIPLPERDTGPHLSYTLQWIAFAIVFVLGLGFLIRRELQYRRQDELEAQAGQSEEGSQDSERLRASP